MDTYQPTAEPRHITRPAPVHPLSSIVTIVLDQFWGVVEIGATLAVAALPALIPLILIIFVSCFVPVMLVQRYVDHDTWGEASAKASVMGIVACVPYPVIGTGVGALLLAWAGVHKVEQVIRRRSLPSRPK